MYQKIIIVGYLGQDPEMRYMPDGTAVTNFSVATSRRWNDASGEKKEETTWFRVSAWGKRGETVNQYFTKGKGIMVEGRLKPDPNTGGPRTFTRQDGTVGTSFEINMDTFSFLPGGGEGGEGGGARQSDGGKPVEYEDEDIPF